MSTDDSAGILDVAVLGAGAFGREHVRAYQRIPGVRVVAVADSHADRAAELARRHGVPRWYDDGLALLDCESPHAISVVTPAATHLPLLTAAVDSGLAVLVEKPVVASAKDAACLEQVAAGSVILPGHVLRFCEPYRELHRVIRAGELGTVLGLSASRHRSASHARRYPDMTPALMTAIHDIDLAIWLTGATTGKATAWNRGSCSPAEVVFATVEADDGSVWSLQTSWLQSEQAPPWDRFDVHGELGVASLECGESSAVLTVSGDRQHWRRSWDSGTGSALEAELRHFCDMARRRSQSEVVSVAEACLTVHIAEAVNESASASGAPVVFGGRP